MYNVLVSGMGSRRNPLGFIITTAGESRGGTSPCYMFYEYCKQVLSLTVENNNLFVYIAEMDSEEEIHDSTNWIKSNPNLDVSVKMTSLQQAYLRAKDGGEMDNFLIKHMNRWIQRKDAYFPLNRWDNKPFPELTGRECYIGVDLTKEYTVHEVRQGYKSLSEPIKFTKELLMQGKLLHGNNPVLKWCTANAVPQFDANKNVILNKAKCINRIDAIASTITAMTQAMMHFNNQSLDRHIDEKYSIW